MLGEEGGEGRVGGTLRFLGTLASKIAHNVPHHLVDLEISPAIHGALFSVRTLFQLFERLRNMAQQTRSVRLWRQITDGEEPQFPAVHRC